jgi:hypothetical protein
MAVQWCVRDLDPARLRAVHYTDFVRVLGASRRRIKHLGGHFTHHSIRDLLILQDLRFTRVGVSRRWTVFGQVLISSSFRSAKFPPGEVGRDFPPPVRRCRSPG